jgi:hypothetical protein
VKVFISVSGPLSEAIGEILREWLPSVIQKIHPFLWSEDLRKGGRWHLEISKQLESTYFGIPCLTKDNANSPWIHFEAGAIARSIEQGRLASVLVDLTKSEVPDPLRHFLYTNLTDSKDFYKLLLSLREVADPLLPEPRLKTQFEKYWDDLETAVNKAFAARHASPVAPTDPHLKLFEEIASMVREQSVVIADLESRLRAAAEARVSDLALVGVPNVRAVPNVRDFRLIEDRYVAIPSRMPRAEVQRLADWLRRKGALPEPQILASDSGNFVLKWIHGPTVERFRKAHAGVLDREYSES